MDAVFNTLTSKQKKVYTAIETFIKSKGIPPTVREIGEMLGEKTPGAVQGILNRLEQKGVIKREIGMARSIQLVSTNSLYIEPVYIPEIKKVTKRNIQDLYSIYNLNKYQPMPPMALNSHDDCFLIKCPDNSLNKISYDDMLVISRKYELDDGDIVLVLYDNHSLLRYYYENEDPEKMTLKADDDLFGKEEFLKSEAIIVGKVICKYTIF
ncbi:MAG TPA: LexA family transcriptional regulator [Clostridiaceae bacterium]|nr:LexA family transcriptional regulator [Clostridiaceae bacterium]